MAVLIFSAVSGFSAPRTAPDAAARTITASFSFAPPEFTTENNGFSRVSLPGCAALQRSGKPLVPFKTVRLALPPHSRITRISAIAKIDPVSLPGKWKLEFGRAPRTIRKSQETSNDSSGSPDADIYQSNNRYPSDRVALMSVQQLAGYDVAVLRVFPLQYLPAAGSIEFTPELDIHIAVSPDIKKTTGRSVSPATERGALNQPTLEEMVENPAMLLEYTSDQLNDKTEADDSFNYLLITQSNLLSSFQALINYREGQGLNVKTELMENIVDQYSGSDSAEKLRNFIRFAYTNWSVQYVLLGGDSRVVPHRGVYANCSGESESFMPSDLYFACLDGSWNSDGDSLWAEPNDGEGGGDIDLLAEVFVGRAPVQTPEEAERFVAKTLDAAVRTPPHMNALFAGEYLSANAQGGDALDPLLPVFSSNGHSVSWLDDRPNLFGTWYKPESLIALNQSPHLVLHYGHSDEVTTMRINNADIDSISNAIPFLLYTTGCDAGAFDNLFGQDCIAEELILRNDHAAFATLSNSREGWYDEVNERLYSGEFQEKFFERLLDNSQPSIGVASQMAKQDMIGYVETSGDMPYRWCYLGITLLGDPYAVQSFVNTAPHIAQNALVFPNSDSVISPFIPTNIIWNPSLIYDDIDLTNLVINRIVLFNSEGNMVIAEVTNAINNTSGMVTCPLTVNDTWTAADCILGFEVIDSTSLTNNMLFTNNVFTLIPEPTLFSGLLLLILARRRRC